MRGDAVIAIAPHPSQSFWINWSINIAKPAAAAPIANPPRRAALNTSSGLFFFASSFIFFKWYATTCWEVPKVSAISFWDQPIPLNFIREAICWGLSGMLLKASDWVSNYNILYNTKNILYLHDIGGSYRKGAHATTRNRMGTHCIVYGWMGYPIPHSTTGGH